MSEMQLNAHEGRVLGVLIEKAFTTPDQYPLSLNAITTGSNQKSNRDPVTDYLEAEAHVAVQGLCHKLMAGRVTVSGSRVERFRHNAGDVLDLNDSQLAVLAELLMRGPQTRGELRQRASRMAKIETLDDLGLVLTRLIERDLVRRLPAAPGSRAERVGQMLAPEAHPEMLQADGRGSSAGSAAPAPGTASTVGSSSATAPRGESAASRCDALERRVDELEGMLRTLAGELGVDLPKASGDEGDTGSTGETGGTGDGA